MLLYAWIADLVFIPHYCHQCRI